jgi:hypothetical protein
MYPVLPLETNQYAAQALLLLFTAVSAVLSAVFCLR